MCSLGKNKTAEKTLVDALYLWKETIDTAEAEWKHPTILQPRNIAATLREHRNNSEKVKCLHVTDTEEKKKGSNNTEKNKPTSEPKIWPCRDPAVLNKHVKRKFLSLQGEILLEGQLKNGAWCIEFY